MNITVIVTLPSSTISGNGLYNFLDDLYDYVDGDIEITPAQYSRQSLTFRMVLDTDAWRMSDALHDMEQLAFVRFKGCTVTFQ